MAVVTNNAFYCLKLETHCMICGCPKEKTEIMKQSWQFLINLDCFKMLIFHLGQPKIVQCDLGLKAYMKVLKVNAEMWKFDLPLPCLLSETFTNPADLNFVLLKKP